MYGILLKVWGSYALFSRPEMKVERVTYDVMTPSAARGILEAIHWKPAIRWVIDEIRVINPIRFGNVRRNEVKSIIQAGAINNAIKGKTVGFYLNTNDSNERQQRASLVLKDVMYVIRAHFEMTGEAGESDTPEKHYNIFLRRARQGQCFHQPYFGCREFPACFELVESEEELPEAYDLSKDLGYMLYDIDFGRDRTPVFFRAQLQNGILKIDDALKEAVNR
ncbi:type I-C CRISPR-associated protein Cas5c [Candidatus Soleaferrea massiliensis]|uniref:type I-C CRISPR-associated protein Cas5c n=1 Tax=Candidatus Soleaferrea massiliensis TaxID=1470354 RepID=UPI00058FDAF1|nr:type I-C CRISPR-associated protein Cas5c [Candidatus Soleaferrea massiliensis]